MRPTADGTTRKDNTTINRRLKLEATINAWDVTSLTSHTLLQYAIYNATTHDDNNNKGECVTTTRKEDAQRTTDNDATIYREKDATNTVMRYAKMYR